jgi:ATP-binding cassette, subfamily B, bacterial PglK
MVEVLNHDKSISAMLARLWRHISKRRRLQFSLLLVLMVLAAFAEVISIGAVLPFLAVLTAPEKLFANQALQPLIQLGRWNQPGQMILPLTVFFGLAALFAGAMRLLLLWAQIRLTFATGADIGINIYHRTLYQPYEVHVARNSSEVISGISGKAGSVIATTIQPVLTLISSIIILVAILAALMAVNAVVALSALSGFGAIYAVMILVTKRRLQQNSQSIAANSTRVIKSLQEGLGGIRDVLIDGCQEIYCQIYRNSDLALRRAQANNFFIGQSPRYIVEALGMVVIAFIAFSLSKATNGLEMAIPVLGTLALGAQRMLPALQQIYGAWSSIRGGQASLWDTLELLDQPLPGYANHPPVNPLPFTATICLNNLSFRYGERLPWVLNQVNLCIKKGSRVGFIGTTGSGKSTLIDIVMGLLSPTEGQLLVDDRGVDQQTKRAWQAHVAHVPQSIFLSDATIEENIAFGQLPHEIDHARVRDAARKAQVEGMVESLPNKYKTTIGERGIRLSGGQRQRIGIARALYKNADVIIFDEATSALDNETEQEVMQAINSLGEDLTILVIAHRLTTLKHCDMVVELAGGVIKRTGSYREIVEQQI